MMMTMMRVPDIIAGKKDRATFDRDTRKREKNDRDITKAMRHGSDLVIYIKKKSRVYEKEKVGLRFCLGFIWLY